MAEEKKGADIMAELTDGLDLPNMVGALYADLGEDAVPALVDHMDDMKNVQEKVSAVVDTAKNLANLNEKLSADLAEAREANAKLMFNQIGQQKSEEKAEEETDDVEDEIADIDDAVSNIEIDTDKEVAN